jgi:hypothetical protein
MKKILLTERQYNLILEENDTINAFKVTIDDAIKAANIHFSKLAFASIADIIDGDIDLEIIQQELNKLEDIYYNQTTKLENFFKHSVGEEEYWAKWDDIHQKLENKAGLLNNKVNTLDLMLSNLQKIVEMDPVKQFSDLETKKI